MSTLREALATLPETVFADLLESDDGYLLILDLPGATADTTDIRVADRRVKIEARRDKAVPDGFEYIDETRSLFLDAVIPLPPDVRGTDSSASMDHGVLELRLPKRSASNGVRVPIESG